MKKIILVYMIVLFFAVCLNQLRIKDNENIKYEISKDVKDYEEIELSNSKSIDFTSLDESLEKSIRELYMLWMKFNNGKMDHIDPTEDFSDSEYLKHLKEFLSKRESLKVSKYQLPILLEQQDMEFIDKTVKIGEKEYFIRIIGYTVDLYVKATTDIVDIKNKWIFVQCWNDDEFYFTTLSDGDVHSVVDFIPLDINDSLCIVLKGEDYIAYPHPPFLWAWTLTEDGFYPCDLFHLNLGETDQYLIYDKTNFSNNLSDGKWLFYTDKSFLLVEKETADIDSKIRPPEYLNVKCETDEETKAFTFTSLNWEGVEESTIKVVLINNRYVINGAD